MEYWFKNTIIINEDICKELQKKYNGVTVYDIHIKYSKNADGSYKVCMVSNAKNEEENIAAKKMFYGILYIDSIKMMMRDYFEQEIIKKQKERSKK